MATSVVSIVTSRSEARRADRLLRGTTRLPVLILIPVAMLIIVGLGAIMSASSALATIETGDSLYYFRRQLAWAVAGLIAMIVVSRIPPRFYMRVSSVLFLGAVALLLATPIIGVTAFGATRWISVGPISIQPSEIAKIATLVFLATLVSRKETSMHRFRDFMWPVAGSFGIVAGLIMVQPDLGTTLVLGFAAFAMLISSAAKIRYIAGSAILGAGSAFVLARISPYRWARVTGFLNIENDTLGVSYQAWQSLVALGTGGATGVGLGASRARWFFLPNAHNDFIFAIIGEESGLVGTLAIVTLFVALLWVGMAIALRAADRFSRLLAVGIVTWLVGQALVNIGGVVGVLPITGVPLPFVSAGGSALLTSMVAVGMLMSIGRHGGRQGAEAG